MPPQGDYMYTIRKLKTKITDLANASTMVRDNDKLVRVDYDHDERFFQNEREHLYDLSQPIDSIGFQDTENNVYKTNFFRSYFITRSAKVFINEFINNQPLSDLFEFDDGSYKLHDKDGSYKPYKLLILNIFDEIRKSYEGGELAEFRKGINAFDLSQPRWKLKDNQATNLRSFNSAVKRLVNEIYSRTVVHWETSFISYQVVDLFNSLTNSIQDLTWHNRFKNRVVELGNFINTYHQSGHLWDRHYRFKRGEYDDYFTNAMFNKNGKPIDGSYIYTGDTSLKHQLSYNKDNKTWELYLRYGDNTITQELPKEWRNTVAKHGIAVADKKIIITASKPEHREMGDIDTLIYKVNWIERTGTKLADRRLTVQGGFIVVIGKMQGEYIPTPLGIRSCVRYQDAKTIAENLVTKETFKALLDTD